MLEIIAKSCQFLTKIKFDGKDIYPKYYKIFGENLGQKLEFIDINNIEIIEMVSLLRFTSNLKAIKIHESFDPIIKQYLPKLENIIVGDIDCQKFEIFSDLYNKKIKKISFDEWNELNEKYIIENLSRFENLESLNMNILYCEWDENFISMAKSLKNLKRLTISIPEIVKSFDCLKVFNKIEIFELVFNDFKENDMKIIETLDLTKFIITGGYNDITDESLEKFVNMKRLCKLSISFEEINDTAICHLIENCPNLKTLELNNIHINETTIEAFIKKASHNPKTYYKFIARTDYKIDFHSRMRAINSNLLKNLEIRRFI
jgi:hypothetical protein